MEKQWIYNRAYIFNEGGLGIQVLFFCQIYDIDYQANSSQMLSQASPI
jgi:hypothetical protein